MKRYSIYFLEFHPRWNVLIVLLLSVSLFGCCKDDPPDPCENIFCENGGACLEGICNCPANTMGKNCEIKIPKRVRISRLNFSTFQTGYGYCLDLEDSFNETKLFTLIFEGSQFIMQSNTIRKGDFPGFARPEFLFSTDILLDPNLKYSFEIHNECPPGDPRDGYQTGTAIRFMDYYNEDNALFDEIDRGFPPTFTFFIEWVYD